MRAADQFVTASDATLAAEDKIKQITKLMEKADIVNSTMSIITKEQLSVSNSNKIIEESEQKILKYNEAKAKVLKDAKVCPICSQIIPDDIGGHFRQPPHA